MKKLYYSSAALIIFVLAFNTNVKSQSSNIVFAESFHRGSFLIAISEGHTSSFFTTKNMAPNSENPTLVKRSEVNGCRNPLFIEYGVTNHWGLGLSTGTDIFSINPADFYGFHRSDNQAIKVATNDFAFSTSYHIFSNKRLDLSIFSDFGVFNVKFKSQESDYKSYQYTSNGNMIRVGSKVRYYFFHHFGAFGMISQYAGKTSPKGVTDNTVANTYTTSVSGFAVEMGFCYRFFK